MDIYTCPIRGFTRQVTVGPDGTVYYADLDLTTGVSPEPGPNGKVWRIRFSAAGEPLPPEVVLDGLAYPDGVAVAAGTAPSPR